MTTSLVQPPDAPFPPLRPQPDVPPAPVAPEPDALPTLTEHWVDRGLVTAILDNRAPLLRASDAGLGAWLDNVLGGGLQAGETLAVGAAGAGIGKTALVHQLADGWAKWSATNVESAAGSDRRPSVVPIVYVTEMGVRQLTIRTLAREAAVSGALLRAPAHFGVAGEQAVRQALSVSRAVLRIGDFITPVDRTVDVGRGVAAVNRLDAQLGRIRDEWGQRADVGAAVLVIDPIHRLLDASKDETGALSEVLGALLRVTQAGGFVTILTSDTTKSAAGSRSGTSEAPSDDDLEAQAEQAFRGSYQLMHVPDHVVMLRALDPCKPTQRALIDGSPVGGAYSSGRGEQRDEWATVFADLPSPKLRWGKVGDRPSFWYDKALFRFTPIPRPATRTAAPTQDELLRGATIGASNGRGRR